MTREEIEALAKEQPVEDRFYCQVCKAELFLDPAYPENGQSGFCNPDGTPHTHGD
jgi:hypothetical protein